MFTFKHLPQQKPERVGAGYGPQYVGRYGPQYVGAAATQARLTRPQGSADHGMIVGPGAGRAHPVPGGGHLVCRPPTGKQVVFLGFGPSTINGGATFVFEGRPQRIFRGERLTVPSAIANNFQINDLKVGTDSMNVGTGPIPASIFSELGMLVALEIETASPGIEILFSITNNAAGPQQFFSGLLGTSVQ
ncbi:MAG: hypothetical protein ACYCPT_01955 [Acidimicrobiales bacterium]